MAEDGRGPTGPHLGRTATAACRPAAPGRPDPALRPSAPFAPKPLDSHCFCRGTQKSSQRILRHCITNLRTIFNFFPKKLQKKILCKVGNLCVEALQRNFLVAHEAFLCTSRRKYLARTLVMHPGQAAPALLSDDAARRGGHSFSRVDVRRRRGLARRDAMAVAPVGSWPAPGPHGALMRPSYLDRAGHRRRTVEASSSCQAAGCFHSALLFQDSASPPSRTPSRPPASRTPSPGRARAASSWTAAATTARCPIGECRWMLTGRRTLTPSPGWLPPVRVTRPCV